MPPLKLVGTLAIVALGLALSSTGEVASGAPVEITRVSVDSNGFAGDNGSQWPAVSADGRLIVFASWASNLVPNDTNGQEDVFLHDRQGGSTTRLSVNSQGAQGNNSSSLPAISSDGKYVAFVSTASNLVPDDTNGDYDIFVRDLDSGSTVRVSISTLGEQASAIGVVFPPAISADGRFVAFASYARNLATDNPPSDVFFHDRDTDQDGIFDEPGAISTSLVSMSSSGDPGDNTSVGPVMSQDGRFIAFASTAANLVPDDTATCQYTTTTYNCSDIFVRDNLNSTIERASVNDSGIGGDKDSVTPSMSADGRYVVFPSEATNLVASDTNGWRDVFVRDRLSAHTERVSVGSGEVEGNGTSCPFPSLIYFPCTSVTVDGRFVLFDSDASNLGSGDTNCQADIFIRDRTAGNTSRLTVDALGNQLNGPSGGAAVSSSGNVFTFYSNTTDLLPGTAETRTTHVYAITPLPVPPVESSGGLGQSAYQDCASRFGDVDCSHTVTSTDALLVLRYSVNLGIRPDCLLSLGNVGCYWRPEIDSVDALLILRRVVGLIASLPECHG